MSYLDLIPRGALDRPGTHLIQLRDEQNERVLRCTRCGADILVCCHVSDLRPESFVGLACGCRLISPPARRLRAAIDKTKAEAS